MKKSKVILTTALTLLLSSAVTAPVVDAATRTGGGVVANPYALNGGVDLLTQPAFEEPERMQTASMSRASRITTPERVILQVPFQTQQTDYWCGPASAKMLLETIGYNYSQQQLANMLGTNARIGTEAGHKIPNVLNSIVKGSRYHFNWEWQQPHEVAKMKGHVVEALSYGNPVIVNTVESPGDVYIAGHNTGYPLYHYGIIGDYFGYGDTVTYVDPAHGRFNGFILEQQVSITNMSKAAGGRGYVW